MFCSTCNEALEPCVDIGLLNLKKSGFDNWVASAVADQTRGVTNVVVCFTSAAAVTNHQNPC
jgi:hypothetical protein